MPLPSSNLITFPNSEDAASPQLLRIDCNSSPDASKTRTSSGVFPIDLTTAINDETVEKRDNSTHHQRYDEDEDETQKYVFEVHVDPLVCLPPDVT